MSPLEQQLSILGIVLLLIVLANIGEYRQSQKRATKGATEDVQKGVRDTSV